MVQFLDQTRCVKLFFFFKSGLYSSRARVAPGAQVLLSGDYKILVFPYKYYAGHPRFKRFTALGSLQFSFEHWALLIKCKFKLIFFSEYIKVETGLNIVKEVVL